MFIFAYNLKLNDMLELIIGAVLYYLVAQIDEHRKVLNRVREANKKLFSNDRPKYTNI